jgi:hypothetical protein
MFYRVTLKHFCCGIVVNQQGTKVQDAAPIMRWAIGKPFSQVRSWVEGKGGTLEFISD